ncbi:MAG: carboxyl transferase domain-containing protein, partial [Planctomycetota bacterium]
MTVKIGNPIQPEDPLCVRYKEAMNSLIDRFRQDVDETRSGGSSDALERHQARGKMFVRDRIQALIDPGSPFLEIGALCAHEVYDSPLPCAGIVTGIAK